MNCGYQNGMVWEKWGAVFEAELREKKAWHSQADA